MFILPASVLLTGFGVADGETIRVTFAEGKHKKGSTGSFRTAAKAGGASYGKSRRFVFVVCVFRVNPLLFAAFSVSRSG